MNQILFGTFVKEYIKRPKPTVCLLMFQCFLTSIPCLFRNLVTNPLEDINILKWLTYAAKFLRSKAKPLQKNSCSVLLSKQYSVNGMFGEGMLSVKNRPTYWYCMFMYLNPFTLLLLVNCFTFLSTKYCDRLAICSGCTPPLTV